MALGIAPPIQPVQLITPPAAPLDNIAVSSQVSNTPSGFSTVPATNAVLAPQNNTQPNVLVPDGSPSVAAQAAASAASAPANNSTSVSFTGLASIANGSGGTLFLTQLIGQGGVASLQAAGGAPSLGDPALLDLYANIRFLPSLAALPSPAPTQPFSISAAQAQLQPAVPQPSQASFTQLSSAASNVQPSVDVRAASPEPSVQSQANIAAVSTPVATQPAPAPAPVPTRAVTRTTPDSPPAEPAQVDFSSQSLLGGTGGLNAYVSSFSRNAANLILPAPQFAFDS